MSRLVERGAREREPPSSASSESKFKETAMSAMLSASLLSQSRNSSDLSQFSNNNITQHRVNDIISEKQEARVDRKIHVADNERKDLISEKKDVLNERSAAIKAEYGSIENYNICKNATAIEANRSQMVDSKRSLSPERNNLIKSEFGSHANYKEVQSISDSLQR
jgi:hypothetical protein